MDRQFGFRNCAPRLRPVATAIWFASSAIFAAAPMVFVISSILAVSSNVVRAEAMVTTSSDIRLGDRVIANCVYGHEEGKVQAILNHGIRIRFEKPGPDKLCTDNVYPAQKTKKVEPFVKIEPVPSFERVRYLGLSSRTFEVGERSIEKCGHTGYFATFTEISANGWIKLRFDEESIENVCGGWKPIDNVGNN